jgi:hypothetical protein
MLCRPGVMTVRHVTRTAVDPVDRDRPLAPRRPRPRRFPRRGWRTRPRRRKQGPRAHPEARPGKPALWLRADRGRAPPRDRIGISDPTGAALEDRLPPPSLTSRLRPFDKVMHSSLETAVHGVGPSPTPTRASNRRIGTVSRTFPGRRPSSHSPARQSRRTRADRQRMRGRRAKRRRLSRWRPCNPMALPLSLPPRSSARSAQGRTISWIPGFPRVSGVKSHRFGTLWAYRAALGASTLSSMPTRGGSRCWGPA